MRTYTVNLTTRTILVTDGGGETYSVDAEDASSRPPRSLPDLYLAQLEWELLTGSDFRESMLSFNRTIRGFPQARQWFPIRAALAGLGLHEPPSDRLIARIRHLAEACARLNVAGSSGAPLRGALGVQGQKHYFTRPHGATLKGVDLDFLDIVGAPGVRPSTTLRQLAQERVITAKVLSATGSWRQAKRAVVRANLAHRMKSRLPSPYCD